MTLKKSLLAAAAVLSLSACGDECATSENPAECRKWVGAGGDVNDYLVGGMAGFLIGRHMAGGQQQSYIYRDPGYHGAYRPMRSPIGSRDQQVRRLERKVQAQRAELKRQQAANADKKREIKALRRSPSASSTWSRLKPSRSSWSRSSTRRRR